MQQPLRLFMRCLIAPILLAVGMFMPSFYSEAKPMQTTELAWYKGTCTAVTISEYRIDHVAPRSVTTSDPALIKSITAYLDQLPTEGTIMVSMAPTNMTIINLTCTEGEYRVEYYDKNIKTPATSFHVNHPAEAELYNLLQAELDKAG